MPLVIWLILGPSGTEAQQSQLNVETSSDQILATINGLSPFVTSAGYTSLDSTLLIRCTEDPQVGLWGPERVVTEGGPTVEWLTMGPSAQQTAVFWGDTNGDIFVRCFDPGPLCEPASPIQQIANNDCGGKGSFVLDGFGGVHWRGTNDQGGISNFLQAIDPVVCLPLGPPVEHPTTGDCSELGAAANATIFAEVWVQAEDIVYRTENLQNLSRSVVPSLFPMGQDLILNTYTTGPQLQPEIGVGESGDFVVVWTSFGSPGDDDSGLSIQARRLDPLGNPLGDQFQVNNYTNFDQLAPAVAVEASGGFVVVWDSFSSPGDDQSISSIQARRFDATGSPLGDQVQVNDFTPSIQQRPDVAEVANGLFMVTWESDGSPGDDDDGFSVQVVLLDFGLFADGFESGDTGAW